MGVGKKPSQMLSPPFGAVHLPLFLSSRVADHFGLNANWASSRKSQKVAHNWRGLLAARRRARGRRVEWTSSILPERTFRIPREGRGGGGREVTGRYFFVTRVSMIPHVVFIALFVWPPRWSPLMTHPPLTAVRVHPSSGLLLLHLLSSLNASNVALRWPLFFCTPEFAVVNLGEF